MYTVDTLNKAMIHFSGEMNLARAISSTNQKDLQLKTYASSISRILRLIFKTTANHSSLVVQKTEQ